MNRGLKTRAEVIGQLESSASAIESGPNSALGKRLAYQSLVIQQRETYDGKCYVSLFSLYTSYTVSIENKKVYPAPALLRIDDRGIIISTSKNHKFMIYSTVYTRLRKDCVVNLCPYVPVNDSDERSCYSTLLVHIPWPSDGEEELLRGYDCAVEYLYDLKRNGDIPSYVNYNFESLHN